MITYKQFSFDNDYNDVYNFLVNNYSYDRSNGSEAPWLSYTMCNLNQDLIKNNYIVYDNNKIIAYFGIERNLGECYFFFNNELLDEMIVKEIVLKAIDLLSVNEHIIIHLYSKQVKLKKVLKELGFSCTGAWKFYFFDYESEFNYSLNKDFSFKNIENDLMKIKECIWLGFDNEGINNDISSIEKIRKLNKHCDLDVFVTDKNGKLVGYAGVWIDEANKLCYLEPFCVLKEYRHLGIGKAIISEVIKRSKEKGCIRITGGISDFYKRIGFTSLYRQELYEK